MKRLLILIFSALIIVVFAGSSMSSKPGEVKSIILMIGDGMGLAQVYAAMLKSPEKLNFERAQYIGITKTYSADNGITDSGAGATAIASGVKTNNGAIGVDSSLNSVKNIREYAETYGKSTGVVVTCNLVHATPAAFLAHETGRYMYSKIALDYINTDADVLVGGGAYLFDSLGVSFQLRKRGFDVCYTLDSINTESGKPVACFVAKDHLLPYLRGRGNYLPEASSKALQLLSHDNDGFFLMVEGSQIDWGGHSNNIDYITSEVIDFDKAVGKAMDYADKNPGTLVLITADHETGGLTWIHDSAGVMVANFSTSDHSGIMVPIYAYGTGADKFSGIMENTEIFTRMMQAFQFKSVNNTVKQALPTVE